MNELVRSAGRRFARLATRAVVACPELWRVFRRPLRAQFDALAPAWHGILGPEALAPLQASLDRLGAEPERVLDIGTGTGKAARLAAERFPAAHVLGVDLAPAMVAEARRRLPNGLADRVTFEVADAASLPWRDGIFDLVVLVNMIPFASELARVTAPGGTLVVSHTSGPATPIWTPASTLRARLAPLGFGEFEQVAAGEGTALLARKAKSE